MYGFWDPKSPQTTPSALIGVECITRFRGRSSWWRKIKDTEHEELKPAINFVTLNEETIIDFMYPEHPNDLERHVGRFRYVQGVPGHYEYWDLYETNGQTWEPFAGTVSYTVKATGEPANMADFKRLAKRESGRKRSVNVSPGNCLTLKLSWYPSAYRYNHHKEKFEGMQQETQEWHQVDPAGTLTEDNQPAVVPDTFWEDLKRNPMEERVPVGGGRFKFIAPRWTKSDYQDIIRRSKALMSNKFLPKICTPMAAQTKIMGCTKEKIFNPLYISKDGHCVYFSACLWMDFQGWTKSAKYLAAMSPGWVIAKPGHVLSGFSERVRSRSRTLPFQLHRIKLGGLFEDIMSRRVRGVYTVIPKPSMHAVVIDATCQLIFDCCQDCPLVLSHENMDKCIGGHACTGFSEARRWSFK